MLGDSVDLESFANMRVHIGLAGEDAGLQQSLVTATLITIALANITFAIFFCCYYPHCHYYYYSHFCL